MNVLEYIYKFAKKSQKRRLRLTPSNGPRKGC